MAPRRELIRAIWDRGVARGELRTDVDLEAAFDLVFGPLLYRLLIGHAPLDEAGGDAIVDAVMRGLAPGDWDHRDLRDAARLACCCNRWKLNVQFRIAVMIPPGLHRVSKEKEMKKMRLIAPLAMAATAAAIGFAPIAAADSTVVQTPGNAQVTASPGAAALQAGQLQYPWFGYGYGYGYGDHGGHR